MLLNSLGLPKLKIKQNKRQPWQHVYSKSSEAFEIHNLIQVVAKHLRALEMLDQAVKH